MGGLWFFFLLTSFYAVIRYKVTDKMPSIVWGIIYVCVLIVGIFSFNMGATKALCGSTQTGTAFIATSIPWVMVFGLMTLMLRIFPGWLSPFSNTIGYLFAKLAGVESILNHIIAPKVVNKSTSDTMKEAAYALEQIYSDKSLIVNQLTESNFYDFWEKLSSAGLFTINADDYQQALLNIVRLKNIVAEYIWALLSGGLAISISNNYISGSACKRSSKEIEQKLNQYEEDATNTVKNAPRVYTKN
jgi:hypothetical protein